MKLNYRIVGSGMPQVIILHGLFGMSDNWQSFARQLAENNCTAILVDLRNHGHSPQDAFHNYRVMAADVKELILELGLQLPVILGHSMGGKVVMQLLCDFPNLISKSIVIDIAPYLYPVHHREILDALLAVDLDKTKSRSEAEKILSMYIDESGTKQFLLKNLYWKSPEHLAWRFNLPVINAQIEEIGEPTWPKVIVETPVLFIRGELSGYVDESRITEIHQWYPNSIITTIKKAGHWVHADQPEKLLEVVLDFIN